MSEFTWSDATGSLDLTTLGKAYATGGLTPTRVVNAIYDRIEARGDDHVWTYLVSRATALKAAAELEAAGHDGRPLWGIPFSVKDCNDIVGLPTTNALKEAAYVARSSGQALDRLFEAGALLIGKTNMDQFGIGLVGMRTPYGACSSVFDERYISGGRARARAFPWPPVFRVFPSPTMPPARDAYRQASTTSWASSRRPVWSAMPVFPAAAA